MCLFVCQHSDVRLTSPPVLMLWGIQGYLWLPYDLTEVINLIREKFKPKNFFFSKKYFMSFLPHYCHSFRITVIPSVLLSFLPDFCHSFRIAVIPSLLLLSFLLNTKEKYNLSALNIEFEFITLLLLWFDRICRFQYGIEYLKYSSSVPFF